MADSNGKPQHNMQKSLHLQRMQQEMKIQKLQQELEERKKQQAQLQQMLSLQQAGPANPSLQLPDAAASSSLSAFATHGTPSVKALPVDAMMQTLRSRMGGNGSGTSASLFPELGLGLNTKLDAFGLNSPDPLMSQSLDMAPQQQQPQNTNKHTINITVKRKTKVDVPGLPIAMQKMQNAQQQAKPKPAVVQPNPAGISPELLSMLDALRAGNAANSAAAASIPNANNANAVATANAVPAQTQQMTIGALTGAPTVPQMANPVSNMIQAAQAVHSQQTGAMSGNMLATAVTASKASNTMADIVDTQMDAMADMAEAGMGFGMMNMMSMGGMNMMGMGNGMGGLGGMGLGGMSGLGMGNGMGMGMGNGMGMGGLGLNRMMSSTFMSPLGMF